MAAGWLSEGWPKALTRLAPQVCVVLGTSAVLMKGEAHRHAAQSVQAQKGATPTAMAISHSLSLPPSLSPCARSISLPPPFIMLITV